MARVLLLHHAPAIGGGSNSLLDLAAMLRERHDVVVSCPETPPVLARRIRSEGYEYAPSRYPFPVFNHFNGGHPLWTRTFWAGLINYWRYREGWCEAIRSIAPDLVIVNSAVLALMGPILARLNVISLCFVRESFPSRFWSLRTRVLRGLLERYFDGVVFLTDFDRDALQLVRPAAAVVHDCARLSLYEVLPREEALSHLSLPSDTYNVLYVGGASRLKGMDVALEALARIRDPRVHLIIAGDATRTASRGVRFGGWRNLLRPGSLVFEKKVARLLSVPSVLSRTHFVGAQMDMSNSYSVADVVIFPATLPHQARPIYEAGLYCLPAVASDYRNTRECLVPGLNGLVFRPRDASDLAEKILRLKSDRVLSSHLGHANSMFTSVQHNFESESITLRTFMDGMLNAIS